MTIEHSKNINTDDDSEELLRCRCQECDTSKKRACNSTRLKELLGNLFDESPGDKFRGLYCRKDDAASVGEEKTGDPVCLCGECELAEGDGRFYCTYCKPSDGQPEER
ncbi:hypothetical protein Dform_01071 [Dehalogenimonas formicexedens]|uniref:Uncharacterized protein n=1 Tax=Dehalogenimonas formicexedens TaxID=1839801 RepID=A0A1P8F7E1_9CHLR|nr:hypothetical protein [Dehalogenimonas formicexedens]APV44406.1 hypothetical protein Dform_01071 [Dehalogenimonas formicexedens]